MKNVLFFVFVLLMVHSFASFGESNYAALLTHMIRNNYLIKKYLPCDDGITGYYMDDMQNLNSNIFQYHNNRYTNTIHDVFVNMGSEKLRNIYHNSISNYAIQTIANMTCILSLLYPSSNDIEYLIENIQLDEDRFVPGRYSQKTRWSFVSNNLTNRVIVRALQEYIVQAYKNIKKKDFIIMTSKLMDLWKHSRPEKEITKDLQQCLFICYTILDPTNIKSMAESYEFMREIQASKPQHWLRFYETNTVFVFATYTDTFQLAELLQNDIKIDGCDDRLWPYVDWEDNSFTLLCYGPFPPRMTVKAYINEIESRMNNEISITMTNIFLKGISQTAFIVRKVPSKKEKELGW